MCVPPTSHRTGLPHNDIAAQICRQAGLVQHEVGSLPAASLSSCMCWFLLTCAPGCAHIPGSADTSTVRQSALPGSSAVCAAHQPCSSLELIAWIYPHALAFNFFRFAHLWHPSGAAPITPIPPKTNNIIRATSSRVMTRRMRASPLCLQPWASTWRPHTSSSRWGWNFTTTVSVPLSLASYFGRDGAMTVLHHEPANPTSWHHFCMPTIC